MEMQPEDHRKDTTPPTDPESASSSADDGRIGDQNRGEVEWGDGVFGVGDVDRRESAFDQPAFDQPEFDQREFDQRDDGTLPHGAALSESHASGVSLPVPQLPPGFSPGPDGALAGEATEDAPGRRKQDSLLEVAVVVLLALVLALLLKTYVAEAYMIRGSSMEPTFRDGQRVMVQKAFFEIERGDVIIFASKEDPRKDLIKRVIALPGERVEVIDGHPYVNDKRFQENYITEYGSYRQDRYGPLVIPSDQYFVLGDNRPESQDSRVFDAVEGTLIKGKVILRWWPFEELRSF